MKNNSLKLMILFISLIATWVISVILHTTFVWLAAENLIAVYIIYKYREFDKTDIVMGCLFGILCLPSSLIMGITIILPYIAAMTIYKNSADKIFLFKWDRRNTIVTTLTLIFIVGGILGGINVFFAINSMPVHLSFKFEWVTDALRAGIFEEIFFRFFFFALCAYLIKGQSLSKFQNILCYAIMVIPHVLIHFDFQNFRVVNLIMLSLLFGLPFAWMQRKVNLVSAIGSHAFVDFIRFCILGL